MISEQDILARLRNGEIQFPPLRLEVESLAVADVGAADAFATGSWGGMEFPFIVEIKRRVSPRVLREVAGALKLAASMSQRFPLLIADWLGPEQLQELEQFEVSGIDLNGNGVIVVPERFFVARSGAPNKYRESVPLRNPYRGESATVARVMLLQGEFQKVEDVWRGIKERGGRLSLASVSKALKVLEDDLMISRREKTIRILQPERLLDRLVAEYRAPVVVAKWKGRYQVEGTVVYLPYDVGIQADDLTGRAPTRGESSLPAAVLTGVSSVDIYATMGREPMWSYYVQVPIDHLLREMSTHAPVQETPLFPNVELLQIKDEWPGFDARIDKKLPTRIWASPLQTYLELANGDQRQRQTAEALREVALRKRWYADE